MNRRGFLGLLTAGVAGGVLAESAAAAQGIAANEIRIGMSAAFRGSAAGLGAELYRGAQAYYSEINARGGVFGRPISVVALDDSYNPEPCIRNTIQLLDREKVFFEAGLTLENKPQVRLRYDYDTREGVKNSTSWGDSALIGIAGQVRKIVRRVEARR